MAIQPDYQDEFYTQYVMDCEIGMKELPESSIDLVVTDPPYGLEFMGKNWDKAVPKVEIWKECLRLLKPGAFAFIMCTPRQDCLARMICNLQDAGFETRFTSIYWTFASGFPKAENISKQVDRKLGIKRPDAIVGGHRGIAVNEDGHSETYNKEISHSIDPGDTSRGTPQSDQAKALDGSYSGFQVKPAVEVIIVAMKPLSEKTYVGQALKNGKGITWLDSCRIPVAENDRHEYGIDGDEGYPTVNDYGEHNRVPYEQHQAGRFPANLLVSGDVLNDGKVTESSPVGFKNVGWKHSGNTSEEMTKLEYQQVFKDQGSFSRYFDLDKWWSERIKSLPDSVQETFPFLIVPKASKFEKNVGIDTLELKAKDLEYRQPTGNAFVDRIHGNKTLNRNNHPTVKPIKLMAYLITLGSRQGDTVLDPFIGSGTTARACKTLLRKCIGFEIDVEQYPQIARYRQNKIQTTMNFPD